MSVIRGGASKPTVLVMRWGWTRFKSVKCLGFLASVLRPVTKQSNGSRLLTIQNQKLLFDCTLVMSCPHPTTPSVTHTAIAAASTPLLPTLTAPSRVYAI